ncbi:MAG TPA: SdrD B-like domain-containing protein, partial [Cellulomonas sp.]
DPLVAVGDRVWLDADRDGIQDTGEDGVGGVVVDLYTGADVWAGETTTDAAGDYLFDGLPAGSYEVRFALPAALAAQYQVTDRGAGSDPAVDSDAVRTSDSESVIDSVVLTADDSGLMTAAADMPADWQTAHPGVTSVDATRDVGLQWRWLSVGDTVWFDTDRDGRQDAGEGPVAGATVRLLAATDDAVLAATTTDAQGRYLFDRLEPGTYRVEVELPAALAERWTFTQRLVGDALGDSDVTAGSTSVGRTALFTLSVGVTGNMVRTSDLAGSSVYSGAAADYVDPTQDAGLAELPVRVGDRVWVDLDADGVQDAGEPGLAGVALTLTDGAGDPVLDVDGDPVGPLTTDADGAYAFTDLLPGTYTVTVDQAASAAVLAPYLATVANASGDTTTDSSTGSATSVALVGGQAETTLDFGFRPLWAIGDRVWFDADRDGVQDVGEPGFAGVQVRLLSAADGSEVATTTTGADGAYRIDMLEPGDYRVEFTLAPADAERYGFSTALAAGAWDAGADSDAVTSATTTGVATTPDLTVGPDAAGLRASVAADGVTASRIDPTWDAGLVELPVSVGDLVWYDADGDGVQDAGEPGLAGVVLRLTTTDGHPVTDAAGDPVGPVTTDADGRYLFSGLLPGRYTVTVGRIASTSALGGYTPTLAGIGSDPAVDSTTWTATTRVLVGGEQDTTLDYGLVLADDVQLALRKSVVSRTATTIVWDVTVASTGTQDAYAGFAVVDALPGALSFTSAEGDGFACTAVAQVVTCDHAGSLPAGERATVRIVTGLTAAGAEVTNTATVDVDGRGYRFEVLSASDVAVSDPVRATAAQSILARTGASAALPLGLAVLLLVLGGVLLAVRRRGA